MTFECNKDYHGVRIDGVQCVTKTDLFGMVERVYQKEENLVRKERKTVRPVSVNKFEEAIAMGFAGADKAQEHFELKEEVKRVSEALKFSNSRSLSMERLLEAIYKNKVADVEKVKSLEGEVAALRSDIGKLTAALTQVFNFEGETKDQAKDLGGNKYVS